MGRTSGMNDKRDLGYDEAGCRVPVLGVSISVVPLIRSMLSLDNVPFVAAKVVEHLPGRFELGDPVLVTTEQGAAGLAEVACGPRVVAGRSVGVRLSRR